MIGIGGFRVEGARPEVIDLPGGAQGCTFTDFRAYTSTALTLELHCPHTHPILHTKLAQGLGTQMKAQTSPAPWV